MCYRKKMEMPRSQSLSVQSKKHLVGISSGERRDLRDAERSPASNGQEALCRAEQENWT